MNRIRKGPLKGWENQAQKEEARRAREDSSPKLDMHVWRERTRSKIFETMVAMDETNAVKWKTHGWDATTLKTPPAILTEQWSLGSSIITLGYRATATSWTSHTSHQPSPHISRPPLLRASNDSTHNNLGTTDTEAQSSFLPLQSPSNRHGCYSASSGSTLSF